MTQNFWRVLLVSLLAGCLPEAAPYRCDLAGGDRACDGVSGSRCIDGSCAAPVSTATCASGFAFSASAATPGRCVPTAAGDAAVDATSRPDAASPDHPAVDAPSDLDATASDRPDSALGPDAPADTAASVDAPSPPDDAPPSDTPAGDLGPPMRDAALPDGAAPDAPVADVPVADVPVADVPRDAGAPFTETPPAPVAKVVGGYFHTCARLTDDRVWCWGSNEQGQLGFGAPTLYVPTPARVNLTDVADVAAGAFHTCALTRGGEVYCWGRNAELQLGVTAPPFAYAPVRVLDAPARVTGLALGAAHSCVSTQGGQVFCWGSNRDGAVGVASSANGPVPPTMVPGVSARVVAAGDAFTCAGGGSTVWCWGRNLYGELGVEVDRVAQSSTPREIVLAVAAGDSLDSLDAGGFAACARGARGVRCWGRTDLGAIPGAPSAPAQVTPVAVPHYVTAPPVLGYVNQCSVDAADALRCWGANDLGASGGGSVTRLTSPPSAALPFTVQRVDGRAVVGLGSAHTCAVDSTGVLRCWGARYFGQLGDGRVALAPTPVEVPALSGAVALAAGRAFTCARRASAPEVSCVGLNNVGQLGGSSAPIAPLPTTEPVPVTVTRDRLSGAALHSISRMSAGASHACAITTTGGLLCWGFNHRGQTNPASGAAGVGFNATQVLNSLNATNVSCGASHTCAVDALRLAHCWGSNDRGESGQATLGVRATGAPVPGLANVVAIAAGSAFTCARTLTGRVECFGANEFGQCGTGAAQPTNITLPAARVPVMPSGAAEVTAGAQHACALVGSGVWCWGANHRGQLGAPVAEPRFIPQATRVMGLGAAEELRTGAGFTCARVAGRVWCWGANHRGQLGDGTFTDRAAPVEVRLPNDVSVAEIATGDEHACARTGTGRVFCWGSNHLAQLAMSDPLWITRAQQSAVRWPR